MTQPAAPPPRGHGAGIRAVVVLAVVLLVGGYAAVAYSTREKWLGGTPTEDRTSVVFTALTPDGSAASSDELDRTREVLEDRADELGESDVSLEGNTLTVGIAGAEESEVRGLSRPGRLYLRPVIHAIPAQGSTSAPSTSAPSTTSPSPDEVADEKSLRQSTEQNVQLLALQFQASRCGGEDDLAGRDDPKLPLVTCSQDGQSVYLLGPSIIDGDDIADASSDPDEQRGQYVVDVEFTSEGAKTWADFTARNIGTQTAFTIDTAVVSAPEIREAIPGGRTQITGQFTRNSARELAGVLGHGSLPLNLTFESSGTSPGPPASPSTALRVALGAAALPVTLAVIATVVYLVVAGRRRPTEVKAGKPQ